MCTGVTDLLNHSSAPRSRKTDSNGRKGDEVKSIYYRKAVSAGFSLCAPQKMAYAMFDERVELIGKSTNCRGSDGYRLICCLSMIPYRTSTTISKLRPPPSTRRDIWLSVISGGRAEKVEIVMGDL